MLESGFVWILLGTGLYGTVHSLLASHAVKGWAERTFGEKAVRLYRLSFSLLAVLGLLPLLAMAAFLPDRRLYSIPFPWVLVSLAAQGLAVWGLLLTLGQTGVRDFLGLRQLMGSQAGQAQAGQLQTGGFYRLVRHPLYTFTLLILWLMPWMSWNTLALSGGISLYILVGIGFEERKLLAEFGPAYAEYRKRTRMLIPWVV